MVRYFESMTGFFSDKNNSRTLAQGKWGLEKESLRIIRTGELALTPHPAVFGDKIENSFIKTDFSESQIEMITPAVDSIEEADEFLKYLHSVVERGIGDELLWPLSMPGQLPAEDRIPAARFNQTEDGIEKEIYRSGLALRYGKKMQMISGIHYNFSFSMELWELLHKKFSPESELKTFVNDSYFALARNFIRYRWLLLYLFGASPSGAFSCADEKESGSRDTGSCIADHDQVPSDATTLRMSSFGYDGGLREKYTVSYNSIKEYVRDLRGILSEKSLNYSRLGIFREGRQVQLNDNILQTENEFYAPLRFKRIGIKGKTQLDNLEEDGVQYMELRIFDLNPFYVTGISLEQLYFIHLFIIYCLFENSDPLTDEEFNEAEMNTQLTAIRGRDDTLLLKDAAGTSSISDRGMYILNKMRIIAAMLDEVKGGGMYQKAVDHEYMVLNDKELLPSSWIAGEMKKYDESHEEFGLRRASENRYYFCMDEINASGSIISGNNHNTESSRFSAS